MPNLRERVAVAAGASRAGLAPEYVFADVDGRRTRPVRCEKF
ncbi:MAG TPA: hypothetical protein VIP46_22305 [Pyrinomonadaceae bacterium]